MWWVTGVIWVPRGLVGGWGVAQQEAQLVGSVPLGAAHLARVLPSYKRILLRLLFLIKEFLSAQNNLKDIFLEYISSQQIFLQ